MSAEFTENETGQGHFQMEIETAGEKTYKSVPVLDTLKVTPTRYVASEFKKGEVFAAFRNGGKGVCSVIINPEKLIVERITPSQEIIGEDAHPAIIINPIVNREVQKAEILGRLRENKLPFSVKIYFVPSY